MWNTYFFLAFLFLPFQFSLGGAGGFDIAAGRIVIAVAVIFWFASALKKKKFLFPSHTAFLLPVLFLVLSALSLIGAEHLDWGARKWIFLANMLAWYFLTTSLLTHKVLSAHVLSKALAWSGAAAAITGITQFSLQYIIGLEGTLTLWRETVTPIFLGSAFTETVTEFPSWLVNVGGTTIFRAVGFFPDPHMLAFFLELTLPWMIFLTIKKRSALYAILSTVATIALLLTFSRGAYLGLLVGGGAGSLWILRNKGSLSPRAVFATFSVAVVLLTGLLVTDNPFRERLFASSPLSDTSTEGRLFLWSHASGLSLSHPFFGVGLGNYPPTLEPSVSYRTPITAHNTYLDIAVEMGAPALLAWIALITLSMRGYAVALKKDVLYGAGIVSLAMFSVHAFFDTALYSVHVVPVLCVVAALGLAAQSKVRTVYKVESL